MALDQPLKMLSGTLVSTDLERARHFYEQAFGFE